MHNLLAPPACSWLMWAMRKRNGVTSFSHTTEHPSSHIPSQPFRLQYTFMNHYTLITISVFWAFVGKDMSINVIPQYFQKHPNSNSFIRILGHTLILKTKKWNSMQGILRARKVLCNNQILTVPNWVWRKGNWAFSNLFPTLTESRPKNSFGMTILKYILLGLYLV